MEKLKKIYHTKIRQNDYYLLPKKPEGPNRWLNFADQLMILV